MARWVVELTSTRRALSLESGDRVDGWRIAETTAGSPHTIIEFPDDWDASRVDQEMSRLEAAGTIVNAGRGLYRPEYEYTIPPPVGRRFRSAAVAGVAVGDTYPSEAIRARGQFGGGVRVGIVDTGMHGAHVAFEGKTVYGDLTDDHGHGTHTASTAAGVWGIASDSEIVMLNGLPGGSGPEGGIATRIGMLADNGCRVISLSLGGPGSDVIDAKVMYARQKGSIVITAAGNVHGATIGSPARSSDLIIMACDRNGQYTEWTSGPEWSNPNRGTAVGLDIAAAAAGTHDGILVMSGTSMATPQVAGMVAVLLAAGMSRQEAIQYVLDHRFPPPGVGRVQMREDFGGGEPVPDPQLMVVRDRLVAIQGECDRDDLRHTVITQPTTAMTKAQLTQLCKDNNAFAADIQKSLGIIWEHAQVALDNFPKADVPPPAPPSSDEEDWEILLDGAAGLVGVEKWLVGSSGSDLFVTRGTRVRAPHDATAHVAQIPIGGGMTIGEITLVYPDGRAVRFRHDYPYVRDGDQVKKGDTVAIVFDPTMDLLRWPRGYPTPPDGYQHLDLSLASSVGRLDPAGGAGGDVDTYNHVWGKMGGLPGFTVTPRTPGPPQSGMAARATRKDYATVIKWFGGKK